jgi:RNA recognition motif-containing protein
MPKLYLGNLAYRATEQDIEHFLISRGIEGRSIQITRDRDSGKSLGYGFVVVDDPNSFHAALGLNGSMFMERAIIIHEGKAREEREVRK